MIRRFVLFKRHYDKYVALAARYEEARGLAYYLEERYHEVKVRRRRPSRLIERGKESPHRRINGIARASTLGIPILSSTPTDFSLENLRPLYDPLFHPREMSDCLPMCTP